MLEWEKNINIQDRWRQKQCGKLRGIGLLSVVENSLTKILIDHMKELTEIDIEKQQYCSRKA